MRFADFEDAQHVGCAGSLEGDAGANNDVVAI
jgi:hypothetical protein